ncbi:MAG TPA: hypothetical protein DCM08_01545 [Microscillaceae bacterium]|nr:hypothetical protein [Microscillaceae bacterium]
MIIALGFTIFEKTFVGMFKKLIGIGLGYIGLCVACLNAFAQKDKVHYINDLYRYVQEKVKNEEYEAYIKIADTEPVGASFVDINGWKGVERFYYSAKGTVEPVLRTVLVQAAQSDTQIKIEYLYDNEGFLLYYGAEAIGESNLGFKKLRAYFDQGESLIELWQDDKVFYEVSRDAANKVKLILEDSKRYFEFFQQKMQQESKN